MSRYLQAQEAYQAMLEGVRANPDDEELREDLERAEVERDVAFLAYELEAL